MKKPEFLKKIAKAALRQPVLAPFLAIWVAQRIKLTHGVEDANSIRILTFDSHRWEQDILALSQAGGVSIYAMDDGVIGLLNACFLLEGVKANEWYYLEDDEKVLHRRQESITCYSKIIGLVKRWKSLDCAVNPNPHYVQTSRWMQACVDAGLPFVSIHKENTVIDDRHTKKRSEEWAERGVKFLAATSASIMKMPGNCWRMPTSRRPTRFPLPVCCGPTTW